MANSRLNDTARGHGLRTSAMWKSALTHLTQTDREKVIQFRDDGMTMTAIAKRFDVSIPTISRFLDEKRTLDKNPGEYTPASDCAPGLKLSSVRFYERRNPGTQTWAKGDPEVIQEPA